jgi:hypothetical protein
MPKNQAVFAETGSGRTEWLAMRDARNKLISKARAYGYDHLKGRINYAPFATSRGHWNVRASASFTRQP